MTILINKFGHSRHQMREYNSVKDLPAIVYYQKQIRYFFSKTRNFLSSLKIGSKNKIKRSERRESIYLVLSYLADHLDLKTFNESNYRHMSTRKRFTIDSIANHLNLTWSRVQRALEDLKKAGYIKTKHHYFSRGVFSTWFLFTSKLFEHLNIKTGDIKKSSFYAETSQKMKDRDASYRGKFNSKPISRSHNTTSPPPPPQRGQFSLKDILNKIKITG